MAIEFRSLPRFNFPSQSGGPQSLTQTVPFPTTVRRVAAAINGFRIGFTNSDHHLYREQIDVSTLLVSNNMTVNVIVTFALRDKSGTFDDPYEGYVDVALMVDRD